MEAKGLRDPEGVLRFNGAFDRQCVPTDGPSQLNVARLVHDERPWGSTDGHPVHPGIICIVQTTERGLSIEPALPDDKMATRHHISKLNLLGFRMLNRNQDYAFQLGCRREPPGDENRER